MRFEEAKKMIKGLRTYGKLRIMKLVVLLFGNSVVGAMEGS
jgi:hypothetical protein